MRTMRVVWKRVATQGPISIQSREIWEGQIRLGMDEMKGFKE